MLPLAALLFLPILIGMKDLYPAATNSQALPPFKAVYLAPWFFMVRSVVYFGLLWLVAAWQRTSWGDTDRMTRSASAGLIIFALLVSFAGVDWLESLEPNFHSSIYVPVISLFHPAERRRIRNRSRPLGRTAHRADRRLQRAAAVDHPPMGLSSWDAIHHVIWSCDIPDEAVWYIERSSEGWQWLLFLVAIGQFVFPFFALLNSRVRGDRRWLLGLCGLTLGMRCCESSILILPGIALAAPWTTCLMLLAALIFVAVNLLWTFEWVLRHDLRRLFSAFRAPDSRARVERISRARAAIVVAPVALSIRRDGIDPGCGIIGVTEQADVIRSSFRCCRCRRQETRRIFVGSTARTRRARPTAVGVTTNAAAGCANWS